MRIKLLAPSAQKAADRATAGITLAAWGSSQNYIEIAITYEFEGLF
jgi:hypothetical protein